MQSDPGGQRLRPAARQTSLSREMISAILRSGRACPPGSTPKHGNPSRQRRCRKDGPVAIANALPDTAVVAVWTPRATSSEEVRRRSDLHPLPGDDRRGPPDAVIVATPTSTHFACAQYALGRDVHLFIEKALTLSPAESRALSERNSVATHQPGRLPQPLHRDLPGGAASGARRRAGECVESSRQRLRAGGGQRAESDLAG